MKKFDFSEIFFNNISFNFKQSFDEKYFNLLLIDREEKISKRKFHNISKQIRRRIWFTPELKIIFFLILIRLPFIIFTHFGMDFNFYIEITQKYLAGESLYTDIPTTHMPLVDFIYITMFFICPLKDNIFAVRIFMKFPFLICDIVIAIMIMKIVENDRKITQINNPFTSQDQYEKLKKEKIICGYFIAFCIPLIFQSAGGRYDSLLILCFVMVVYYMQKNNWFGIAFFSALGTSTKYIGLIILPFILIWIKKEDLIHFAIGLILGLTPTILFLVILPEEFFQLLTQRSEHIAYGFSIWHAIFIIWNGFNMKFVRTVDDTYDSSGEPFFVRESYLPTFFILYAIIFYVYFMKNQFQYNNTQISELPLLKILAILFVPLFIFSLSFKAVNLQILAWFIPFIALNKKRGLLIEYSILTILHGFSLVCFEIYNAENFMELVGSAAPEGSIFYNLVIMPAFKFTQIIPMKIWVGIIFLTIIWFILRTSFELFKSVKNACSSNNIRIISTN